MLFRILLVFAILFANRIQVKAQRFSENPYPMDSVRPGIRKVTMISKENRDLSPAQKELAKNSKEQYQRLNLISYQDYPWGDWTCTFDSLGNVQTQSRGVSEIRHYYDSEGHKIAKVEFLRGLPSPHKTVKKWDYCKHGLSVESDYYYYIPKSGPRLQQRKIYVYSESGTIIRIETLNYWDGDTLHPKAGSIRYFDFTEDGIRRHYYGTPASSMEIGYYDSQGYLSEKILYRDDTSAAGRKMYSTYNYVKGQLSKCVSYDRSDKIKYDTQIDYREDMKITRVFQYQVSDKGEQISEEQLYFYDSAGHMIRSEFRRNGIFYHKVDFHYDANGDLVDGIFYDANGISTHKYIVSYEYY